MCCIRDQTNEMPSHRPALSETERQREKESEKKIKHFHRPRSSQVRDVPIKYLLISCRIRFYNSCAFFFVLSHSLLLRLENLVLFFRHLAIDLFTRGNIDIMDEYCNTFCPSKVRG